MDEQMNEIKELNERTESICEHERTAVKSFMGIGSDLQHVNTKRLYKARYNTFEDYIIDCKKQGKFKFGVKHAYKIIGVYEKFGNVASMRQTEIGLAKLIILAQVPEEHVDEFIEMVQDKNVSTRQLEADVQRSKGRVGSESHYADTLTKPARRIDHLSKLKREHNGSLKEEYERIIRVVGSFKEKENNWLNGAKKHSELRDEINEAHERLRNLD